MSLNCIQGRTLFVQRRSHPSLHWQGDQCDHLDDDNQFDDLDESNTVLFEYWLPIDGHDIVEDYAYICKSFARGVTKRMVPMTMVKMMTL